MTNEEDPAITNPDRRRLFAATARMFGAVVLAGSLPTLAFADDLPHVSTADDPTAKLLNYTEDASTATSTHQAGQSCASCNFFRGGNTGYAPCRLYPGKAVNAKGWCSGYAARKT